MSSKFIHNRCNEVLKDGLFFACVNGNTSLLEANQQKRHILRAKKKKGKERKRIKKKKKTHGSRPLQRESQQSNFVSPHHFSKTINHLISWPLHKRKGDAPRRLLRTGRPSKNTKRITLHNSVMHIQPHGFTKPHSKRNQLSFVHLAKNQNGQSKKEMSTNITSENFLNAKLT